MSVITAIYKIDASHTHFTYTYILIVYVLYIVNERLPDDAESSWTGRASAHMSSASMYARCRDTGNTDVAVHGFRVYSEAASNE